MDENILVSIITVCYNSAKTIEDTVKAVLSQTYPNWEHIIVDGGSTDRTIEIINSYKAQYGDRLKIYQGPDKGIYDAMNKGIGYAKGEIVGIINSDDWYAPDAIENIVAAYNSCSGTEKVITGGLVRVRDEKPIYTQKHTGITLAGLKKGMPLQHPAVFVTKDTYKRIGTFDLSYPHIADYDLIWRCYADGNIKFLFVEPTVSYMRDGGASDCLSWKHIWSRTTERYRLRKKYIPKMEAFCSSSYFLVREYAFQLTKKTLGTKGVKKAYDLKRGGAKELVKQSLHSVNKVLKKMPAVRNALVYTYHFGRHVTFGCINAIKGRKTGILTNGCRITPDGKNCYFGYYDKTPFSSDGTHYLFLMINGKKTPALNERAKVCYATDKDHYEVIGETSAWNLQQGAMLRFMDDRHVSWNDYDHKSGRYINVIYNISTKECRVISHPIYDISDDLKHGLSIDFERLNVDAEGYGYIQQGKKEFDADSYIDVVDMSTGEARTIITIESLTKEFPIPDGATFSYFNHLEFNPSGNRFIFIFRYTLDQKRYSRLFSSDLSGNDIHLLANDELVSHCTWLDNSHITLWCRLNGKNNYYTISDSNDADYCIVGSNTPKEDGHPSYNDKRTLMITDTYPDKAEYRHLIVYDCKSDQCRDLARFYAPILLHGPLRCDFHPRWHPNMLQVAIDSVHEGYRGLYLINIE